MIGSAEGTFTRKNLKLAFDDYVVVNGEAEARAKLKEATGVEDIKEVSDTKIIVGVAALVSSLTIPSKPRMNARTRQGRGRFTLAAIHSRLDEIRAKAFGRAT
jgi:hypothetical protein